VIVYRIETDQGYGPYVWGNPLTQRQERVRTEIINAHNDGPSWTNHPTPQEDGLGRIANDEYCCFTSKRALRTWFKGFLQDLHDVGFFVHVYEVDRDDVRRGGHQAMFVRHRATKVRRFSPLEVRAA
jgi:hypothetical protein